MSVTLETGVTPIRMGETRALAQRFIEVLSPDVSRQQAGAALLLAWHHLNTSVVGRHLSIPFLQEASQKLVDLAKDYSRTGTSLLTDFPPHTGDPCLDLFSLALRTWQMPIKGRVLEIGCCEADWVACALKADPTLQITGVDWRDRSYDSRWTFVRGDVNQVDFEPESFDWVVSISAIEHVGLGHYEKDPVREDGDSEAIRRAVRWLKPGGSLYFDVPYTPEGFTVDGTKHRTYDAAALRERLFVPGLVCLRQGFVDANDVSRWLLAPSASPDGKRRYHYAANWWMKERE